MRSTIFALASGRPPAAIAIIRASGPLAHPAGSVLAGDLPSPRQAAVRTLRSAQGDVLDEALVLRFDGPASATGEDVVEFHCHGGHAVVDAVLSALSAQSGLRLAEPGEFTRRAFENGRIDLTEAEGLADLLEAETESQRKAALAMADGGLRRQVEQWQAQVLALSARAEAAIDYVDEDDLGADPTLAEDCARLARELDRWLQRPRSEPLREGVSVVLAGPPNSGKSSLINAIAGSDRAIVTDIAGTTRDAIHVPLALEGVPFTFIDTAGIRETSEPVESIGVDRARAALGSADIIYWLGDPSGAPKHPRLVLVHGRADMLDRLQAPSGSVAVSATTGEGLDELLQHTITLAKQMLPAGGELALNRRQAQAIQSVRDCLQDPPAELILIAESLRVARLALDRLTGRAGVEELLDSLFGRFCLGK